jgi:putative ATP-dependent endonuclease of the OLD family
MQICRLTIRRYRGLANFTWLPSPSVNCLIGPADSGKSTVLAAISLLLAPYPVPAASEFDYLDRNIVAGFEVEACLSIPEAVLATERVVPPLWGWRDGQTFELPEDGSETVIVARVRGTADLEVVHELLSPAGDSVPLSVGLRRKLLLARLAGEDRATRDLRVTQGSMLDRFLGRTELRGTLATAISVASRELLFPEDVGANVQRLSQIYADAGLPSDLHLGLAATPGFSLPTLVTLLEGQDPTTAVPLALAGTGTRQLALLELSAALANTGAVVVVDEPERGLEPYRQRIAARRIIELAGNSGQAYITTHAPAVLGSMPDQSVWRMANGNPPVRFTADAAIRLLQRDPAAFFAPLPFVCEGDTEVGFNSVFLPNRLGSPLESLGIHLIDATGQRPALDILDAFMAAGIICGGFIDNETEYAGRRARITGPTVTFFWAGVRNIEEAVAHWLASEDLYRVADWAAEAAGIEARHFAVQVRDRVPGATETDIAELIVHHGETAVRAALADAMNRHSWFKRKHGGRLLGERLLDLGLPASMEAQLAPFVQRLRGILP